MNLNIFRNFGKKNNINQSQPRNKGHIKEFMAKLSRGLMLPIAMLPIAGLFLGIGNAIFSHAAENSGLWVFGNVIGFPGKVIFSCLPVLFAIAIAITFTKDSGTAGLSALVG
jgi:PTS system glucose-specific IIC component